MIEHNPRRAKELHQEFKEWLNTCDKYELMQLVGLERLEQVWLANRLKNIKKEYGVD